jgi:hypothetical protein
MANRQSKWNLVNCMLFDGDKDLWWGISREWICQVDLRIKMLIISMRLIPKIVFTYHKARDQAYSHTRVIDVSLENH